jgi:hypothetical protein
MIILKKIEENSEISRLPQFNIINFLLKTVINYRCLIKYGVLQRYLSIVPSY